MADEVTKPRPEGEEEVQDVQITLTSSAVPSSVRDLKVSVLELIENGIGITLSGSRRTVNFGKQINSYDA